MSEASKALVRPILGEPLAEGDRVATRITVSATRFEELRGIPATGERIAITGSVIHRVADGRLPMKQPA